MLKHKFLLGLAAALLMPITSAVAEEGEGPPWPDKGPRILFNTNDVSKIPEVVPKTFYLGYWHSPTTTVVYNRWIAGPKGHLLGEESIHGEEYGYLVKGRLAFIFDESRSTVVVDAGQFIHWPNIAHWGTCMTKECVLYAFFVPTRDDYGPEGQKMTSKSNVWISSEQGK